MSNPSFQAVLIAQALDRQTGNRSTTAPCCGGRRHRRRRHLRDLRKRYPNTAVIGSGNEIMLPWLVNGHHHVGLTPVQLGSPDMPLELWFHHPHGDAQSSHLSRHALFGVRE